MFDIDDTRVGFCWKPEDGEAPSHPGVGPTRLWEYLEGDLRVL